MSIPGKKNKKKTKFYTAAVVLAVLILAAAIGGYLIWNNMNTAETAAGKGDGISGSASHKEEASSAGNTSSTVTYQGKEYAYNDHLSNFLFLGIDSREKTQTQVGRADAGQADAIFLVSWDRVDHSLTGITIPRDTITEIQIFDQEGNRAGKSRDHINLAYAYGDGGRESCELMEEAVSNLLYGIPMQGYCSLSMDGIPLLVEKVGGVTVTVPDDSLEAVNPQWTQGSQIQLTPDNVEDFVRYRDTGESQSAIVRMERQQEFLNAYAAKARQVYGKNPSLITDLYTALEDYMVTDISNGQFAQIMGGLAEQENIRTWTLPGEGTQGEGFDEYHVDDSQLYEKILETFYKEVEN